MRLQAHLTSFLQILNALQGKAEREHPLFPPIAKSLPTVVLCVLSNRLGDRREWLHRRSIDR